MLKYIVAIVFLACTLAVVSGCESLGNPSFGKMFGPVGKLDPWIGKHRDQLVNDKDWGRPKEEKPSENGIPNGRTLVYDTAFRDPGQHFKFYRDCLVKFHTDAQGTIRAWSYEGC